MTESASSNDKFGLNQRTINALSTVFARHPEIKQAILYGSRAKGTHSPGSDIDLTLLGEALTYTQLNRIETEIDDLLLPYTVDLSLHQQIDNAELLDHIRRVGQVFYQSAP